MHTLADLERLSGVTRRVLQHWVDKDVLKPAKGGDRLTFADAEAEVAMALRPLGQVGLETGLLKVIALNLRAFASGDKLWKAARDEGQSAWVVLVVDKDSADWNVKPYAFAKPDQVQTALKEYAKHDVLYFVIPVSELFVRMRSSGENLIMRPDGTIWLREEDGSLTQLKRVKDTK